MTKREKKMNISQIDFESWKAIPATQEFFREVDRYKHEREEILGRGQTLDMSSAEQTLALTAKLVGIIFGINWVLNIRPETDEGNEEDND